jgi:hypothetical protein
LNSNEVVVWVGGCHPATLAGGSRPRELNRDVVRQHYHQRDRHAVTSRAYTGDCSVVLTSHRGHLIWSPRGCMAAPELLRTFRHGLGPRRTNSWGRLQARQLAGYVSPAEDSAFDLALCIEVYGLMHAEWPPGEVHRASSGDFRFSLPRPGIRQSADFDTLRN